MEITQSATPVTADEVAALATLVPDPVPDAAAIPGAERSAETSPDDAAVTAAKTSEESTEPPVEKVSEKAAETPAPDAVDADALAKAEAAAKKAREGSRRYRELQEQQRQQSMAAQRAAREAQELRQQAEADRRFRELLQKDPYAALKQLGMKESDLAERALRESGPEALVHSIREELAAERAARNALEQRLQQERQTSAQRAAEQAFARVADDEAAYPRLAQLNTSAQLAVARAALKQIADNGYDAYALSDEQVAEACERYLAPKKGAKAPAKPAPAPVAKSGGKTLTNTAATTRAVAPKPWQDLSEEEQIAQIAASLPDPS